MLRVFDSLRGVRLGEYGQDIHQRIERGLHPFQKFQPVWFNLFYAHTEAAAAILVAADSGQW